MAPLQCVLGISNAITINNILLFCYASDRSVSDREVCDGKRRRMAAPSPFRYAVVAAAFRGFMGARVEMACL